MNEKTPNLQTQAAMKEARAMAIKRVPELAESTVDTGHPALLRMWDKRQRGYRAMGYRIGAGGSPD